MGLNCNAHGHGLHANSDCSPRPRVPMVIVKKQNAKGTGKTVHTRSQGSKGLGGQMLAESDWAEGQKVRISLYIDYTNDIDHDIDYRL